MPKARKRMQFEPIEQFKTFKQLFSDPLIMAIPHCGTKPC
jgi:hypothetical protein